MPRNRALTQVFQPTSNFAYMRQLQQPPPQSLGAPVAEFDCDELERAFTGVKIEFQDLDGVRPRVTVQPNQLPTSSQPGALSNRSSQSPVASPPSALADEFGFSRACDEEGGDDDDDDTIRPKRRERTFSSAATIFPDANTMSGSPHTNDARSAGMLFDDDPFRRLDEEDECTPERPPSRCGFLDDEDEGDEPPQYVGGAALARYN